MDLSVVIGTFNQGPVLRHVLASFADQTHPADRFEVIVVDSESSDDTGEVCNPSRYPFTLVYVRTTNEGKCRARNIGVAAVRSSVVLLTDADVLADRALIATHLAARVDFPGAVIVGQQFMVNSADRDRSTGRPCLDPRWSRGRTLSWREFVTGNASLDRQALVDAGGFDEGFRGYGFEDYELGYRLAERGVGFVFDPAAINYHFHPVAFERELQRKREAGRAAEYFARRHPSHALRVHLGLTPLNRTLYGCVHRSGWIERACRALQHRDGAAGRFARHLRLEIEYHRGAIEAWRERHG